MFLSNLYYFQYIIGFEKLLKYIVKSTMNPIRFNRLKKNPHKTIIILPKKFDDLYLYLFKHNNIKRDFFSIQ